MTRAIAVAPATLGIGEAARLAHRRRARVVVARVGRGWGGVSPGVLAEAGRLGLERGPLGSILWGMPVVEPGAPEVVVRRLLDSAHPFALVVGRSGPLGVVLREAGAGRGLPLRIGDRLTRVPERIGELLRAAGVAGEALGYPVGAVGGVVRDLLLRGTLEARADVDLVVEGDGPRLARRVAQTLGGRVREHAAFLTATLELPDGARLDVATARRERYRAAGALPDVTAAPLSADLARRDFSLNALAVRLDGRAWGEVMDPTGGLADLRERRIRILHPLSFVEDPTRTFRAVRFAVRLACRLEPTTARLLRAAARLGGLGCYPALSGARLRAELEAGLAEADPARVLAGLGQVGAFRLLDPDFRLSRRAEPRLRASVALAERAALTSELRLALLVLALTADRRPARTTAWAERLDLAPALRRALVRSAADAPGILADLRGVTDAADAHARLHQVPELTAAWARLLARGARSCRFLDLRLGPWRTARPLLSGDDVLALGVQPGPTLGALLTAARGEQAAGRIRTREDALRWAQAAVARTISAASGPESTPG